MLLSNAGLKETTFAELHELSTTSFCKCELSLHFIGTKTPIIKLEQPSGSYHNYYIGYCKITYSLQVLGILTDDQKLLNLTLVFQIMHYVIYGIACLKKLFLDGK